MTASERVVIDPTQLDSSGTTVIDFYVPSIDGKYVAATLSKAGSESGDVHVYVRYPQNCIRVWGFYPLYKGVAHPRCSTAKVTESFVFSAT